MTRTSIKYTSSSSSSSHLIRIVVEPKSEMEETMKSLLDALHSMEEHITESLSTWLPSSQ